MEENNIQEIKKKADKFESQYARLKQDFKEYIESSRKNEGKIKQEMQRDFIKRLLVVADSFDRISKLNSTTSCDVVKHYSENVKENINVMYHQLLAAAALTPIDPKAGDEFDANKHMAVGLEYSSVYPENSVFRTVRKGYSSGDYIVRPCEIIVSKRPVEVTIKKSGVWNRFLRRMNPSKYRLRELDEKILQLEGLQSEMTDKIAQDMNTLNNSIRELEEKIAVIKENALQQGNADDDRCQGNESYETNRSNINLKETDDVE